MWELILATIMAFTAVGILCYTAGADEQKRRDWEAQRVAEQYRLAMGAAKQRHPSSR